MDWQRLSWTRRMVPLSQPVVLDRHGWPVVLAYAGGAGRPLAALRNVPLVVLRAEWGTGKSIAFEQEHAALRSAAVSAQLVDLGKSGTDVGRAEAQLSGRFQPPAGQGEWHVLLDGLDEGMDDLRDLPQLIVEQLKMLKDRDRGRLRLRISCRTARWPAEFEADLRRLWPEDGQRETVTLIPLSRDDVSSAVGRTGVTDIPAFLELIERRGLVSLAAHPMTLRQLLESYQYSQSLPATAADAYRQACVRLCTETRRPKTSEQRHTRAAPEHLLAVATRVAAALQFGKHSVVFSDSDSPEDGPVHDAVALSRLSTGSEPGHLGHEVPCTMAELRQLTESSLFAPVGDHRWAFTHNSYREFLAAEFLRAHQVSPVVLRELLWVGDGPNRQVIPAQQEVAAWLSGSEPAVFEDLCEDDPAVALLSRDLPTRPEADRARLADALLELLKWDDTAELNRVALHRLDHPALADQLRPVLAAGAEHSWLVYWAASIACRFFR